MVSDLYDSTICVSDRDAAFEVILSQPMHRLKSLRGWDQDLVRECGITMVKVVSPGLLLTLNFTP